MTSRFSGLRDKAVRLRIKGASIRNIEEALQIPRSTLSGWLRNVELPPTYRDRLERSRKNALILAREKAALRHTQQKMQRIEAAKTRAERTIQRIGYKDKEILKLALAMLYWGEGTKREKGLVLGNADPNILNFFISALCLSYRIDLKRMRCEVHIRADQRPSEIIKYWCAALAIPQDQFKGVYFDKRTIGKKSRNSYKGVCIVSYYDVAIQRDLLYLYQLYCQKVIRNRAVSSVGRARH
ncbi:MAG TPA: hypothetical protein VHD55_00320 [Candidatus Paceibacterota bacterium]|nr:hypothetical protein [Candidatus Paceibacterota bacterium]